MRKLRHRWAKCPAEVHAADEGQEVGLPSPHFPEEPPFIQEVGWVAQGESPGLAQGQMYLSH